MVMIKIWYIFTIKNINESLWDKPKPFFLGYSFYKTLYYLMSNESILSIISSDAKLMGHIIIDIVLINDNVYHY